MAASERNRPRRSGRVSIACFCVAWLAAPTLGCFKGAANQAAQGVLEATAKETKENQGEVRKETTQLVSEVATDPKVQAAMHDLASATVLGATDGIDSARVNALTETFINATFDAMERHGDRFAQHMVGQMQPQLMQALRAAVAQSVDAASSTFRESAQRDLPAITQALMESSLEAARHTLTAPDPDAPPGGPGEDTLVRAFTRQAVRGVDDGLQAAAQESAPGVDTVLRHMGDSIGRGIGAGILRSNALLIGLSCVFLAILLGLGATLALVWRMYRRSIHALELLAARTLAPLPPVEETGRHS